MEVENDKAEIEKAKCERIATDVAEKSSKVQAELDLAVPLVEEAMAALD